MLRNHFIFYGVGITTLCYIYKKYCKSIAFEIIEENFPRKDKYEFDLSIYKPSLPFSYTSKKKSRCILLISGYRDTPYLWNLYVEKLKRHEIDFYAPRTHSKGRSYFQKTSYKDWILTYFETLSLLENQYDNIDIIALSAGSFIATYISQFEYKCNINNIFLCSPYLCVKNDFIYNLFYKTKLFPFIDFLMNHFINLFLKFRIKFPGPGYISVRNIYNYENMKNDYFECVSCYRNDNEVFKMLRLKINKILLQGDIYILYNQTDFVIPDIKKQVKYLYDNEIIEKKGIGVEIIHIPKPDSPKEKNKYCIDKRCGHVMFKESDKILEEIDETIFSRLNTFYNKKNILNL